MANETINEVGTDDPAASLAAATEDALKGGDRSRLGTKLPVRERLALLLDQGSFVEDGLLASMHAERLPADAVITGTGRVDGLQVAVIAHDPTVKAGSWGPRTVEKQIRILERADRDLLPVFFLVDSAGGRLTEQIAFHPGPRGAARIFHLQVRLSGRVPQICCLFGPSAAGGAYMPAFCDWVGMVDGNASMFLASPRIAEKAVGEVVSLEEMGGARMHTEVSGCGDALCADDADAIAQAKRFFSYLPPSYESRPEPVPPREPAETEWEDVIPENLRAAYDIATVIERIVDAESFFEVKPRWAKEIVVGFARLDGESVGIVASQPNVKTGAIQVDSADKAASFITLCDAFNLPLRLPHRPARLHDRLEGRARRDHPPRRQDDRGDGQHPGPANLRGRPQGLRGRLLRDVLPRLRAARDDRPAERPDRRDGQRGRRQRRLRQPPGGDGDRRRARDLHRRARARVRAASCDPLRLASDLLIDAVVEPTELRRELILRLAAAASWQAPFRRATMETSRYERARRQPRSLPRRDERGPDRPPRDHPHDQRVRQHPLLGDDDEPAAAAHRCQPRRRDRVRRAHRQQPVHARPAGRDQRPRADAEHDRRQPRLHNGKAVDRKHLLPGDLVFFRDSTGDVHHVGMSLGGDKFIQAPHTGDVVKISSLKESYYAGQFTGGRRFDQSAGQGAQAAAAAVVGKAEQGYAPGVNPDAARAAEAALVRDAAEAQRPGTLLFKAVQAQELSNAHEAQVLRALDRSASN